MYTGDSPSWTGTFVSLLRRLERCRDAEVDDRQN